MEYNTCIMRFKGPKMIKYGVKSHYIDFERFWK